MSPAAKTLVHRLLLVGDLVLMVLLIVTIVQRDWWTAVVFLLAWAGGEIVLNRWERYLGCRASRENGGDEH